MMRLTIAPVKYAKVSRKLPTHASRPGARHPIFRAHPITGRKALYLGRRLNAYIIGLSLDESVRSASSTHCGNMHRSPSLFGAMSGNQATS